METGGGVKNAIQKFKNSSLLIVNGDSHLSNKQKDSPVKKLITSYKKSDMDVLLLLSKKQNTFGYNGAGDYYKLNCSVASKLTTKDIGAASKYIFTGWQIINKEIINNFSEKVFSLKRVYDLAEKKDAFME